MKKILFTFIMIFVFVTTCVVSAAAFDYTGWLWPVKTSKKLSQGFHSGHDAIDISDSNSITPIYASKAGVVWITYTGCNNYSGWASSGVTCKSGGKCAPYKHTASGTTQNGYSSYDMCNGSAGNCVVINHGNNVISIYAHLQPNLLVSPGQYVEQGTIIGYMGSSGASTGKHLHFSIRENAKTMYLDSGTAVNNNPVGDEYVCYGSYNGIDTIKYSHNYTNTSISVEFSEYPEKYFVNDTNACLSQTAIYSEGTCTRVGIILYDSNGNEIAKKSEEAKSNINQVWMWYDVNEELGLILKPGTSYSYKFFVLIDGEEYFSLKYQVKTTGEHTHSWDDWTDDGAGFHERKCSCGALQFETHEWNNGTITLQPTCSATGIKTFKCLECFATLTETIEKTNHKFENWIQLDNNKHIRYCSCGASETANHTPASDKIYYEASHAHREYKRCACGFAIYTGTYRKLDDCDECNYVAVTGVSLDKTTANFTEGESLTLTATVAPSNATNKNVTWSSSNTSVATVSNGVVTAKSAGEATITVKTADGSKTATCVVTVIDPVIPDTPADVTVYTEAKKSAVQGSEFTFDILVEGTYDGYAIMINKEMNGLTVNEVIAESGVNVDDFGDVWMISVIGGLSKANADKEKIATAFVSVSKDAELGERLLSLVDDTMITTETGDVAVTEYSYATINITDQIPGDINGDGVFNYSDVSKLYALFRKKTTVSENIDTDINGDGKFNYSDVSKLYAIFRKKADFN